MPGYRPPRLAGLNDLLKNSVRNWPGDPAVGIADRSLVLSYRELDANVQGLSAPLGRLGVRHGDAVAIVSDNCVEFAVALLAVVSVGAAAAPVDPALTAPQVASRLAAIKAAGVIVPEHMYGKFVATRPDPVQPPAWKLALGPGDGGRPQATVTGSPASTGGHAQAAGQLSPADVALLLFTSGTTATPKVVPLSHANLAASISGICATYQLGHSDTTLMVMPLYHGHGLMAGLLASLASGGVVYLPRGGKFSAGTFWSDLVNIGATWYTAVPTIHQILLGRAASDYPRGDPPPLRFIRSCSAPLAPAVLAEVEATFGAPLIEAYGMTETTHQTASNPLPAFGPHKTSSVGLGTGVTIRILGPGGEPVQQGEVGEVCVQGATVASGYLDNPQDTRASFVDGWFHTGDLGFQDAGQFLFLQGRIKELINRGGEKISRRASMLYCWPTRESRRQCLSVSRMRNTGRRSKPLSSCNQVSRQPRRNSGTTASPS